MARAIRSWDDYFIPGTEVLKNKFNETDPELLARSEELATALRLQQLWVEPLPGHFDYNHMKAIHRYIFQDVYDWAGEERVGPLGWMSKGGPDVVNFAPGDPNAPMVPYSYYPGAGVAEAAADRYRLLARDNNLVGLPRAEFIAQLAEHWAELNVVHSFREGNTRTQFVFFSQLVHEAGFELDTESFKFGGPLRDEFVWARFHSQATGTSKRLAGVLDRGISETRSPSSLASPVARDRATADRANEAVQLASSDFPKSATAAAKQRPTPPARPGTSTRSPAQDRTNGMER